MPRVTEVNVYPIKSCGRIARHSAEVRARGLDGDRRYMLVDAGGRFMTQRQHEALARVRVRDDTGGGYRVDAPGRPALRLPAAWPEGPEVEVTVWRDTVRATAVAKDVSEWFSAFLGFECRLVYLGEHQHRAVPNDAAAPGDEVGFADAAPLLLTTEAFLGALNARLRSPVAMARFRPNLVVDGDAPFAEDSWRLLRIGEVELEVAWPCARCVLTTIEPETGVRDPAREPLVTLRKFRKGPGGALFGQNLIPRRLGTIAVGDTVEVR